MQDAPHIPTDLEAAQALVVELSRAMLDLQESRDGLSREVAELKLSIAKLMQRLYGQKSERVSGWCPSRSTLENILQSAEGVVRPLADYYRQQLLTDTVIGCDETRVTLITPQVLPELDDQSERSRRQQEVLKEAIEKGKPSLEARMWAYRGVTLPINVFDFTVARRRYGPDDVLSSFRGILMADCWSGFQRIEVRSDLRIEFAACWAHARRKIHECLLSHPQQATILLAMLRQLYEIEDRTKNLTAEQRLVLRQAETVPVLNRIRAYLDSAAVALPRVLPKSDLATAVGYIQNNWDALLVFSTKGSVPIDNNDVEQLMKQVALGRKNWLHVGSPEAGDRAATWMTIISTAVRNDLDVPAYLNDVLQQLLASSTDYAALRADVWKASHPESVRAYRVEVRRNAADRTRLRRAQRRLKAAEDAEPH